MVCKNAEGYPLRVPCGEPGCSLSFRIVGLCNNNIVDLMSSENAVISMSMGCSNIMFTLIEQTVFYFNQSFRKRCILQFSRDLSKILR
jgi:hypothetical protein